jgi:hypothetical protein
MLPIALALAASYSTDTRTWVTPTPTPTASWPTPTEDWFTVAPPATKTGWAKWKTALVVVAVVVLTAIVVIVWCLYKRKHRLADNMDRDPLITDSMSGPFPALKNEQAIWRRVSPH